MIDRVVDMLRAHTARRIDDSEVEIVPDPQIKGLYAARVGRASDYLVRTGDGTGDGTVEEVRFDEWPPR